MKKKILIFCGGLWTPAVKMAGTKAIYNHLLNLQIKQNISIDILTTLPYWANKSQNYILNKFKKKKMNIFFIREINILNISVLNLLINRLRLFILIFLLNKKNNYNIIHDYISYIPFLLFYKFFKIFTKTKIYVTFVTFNKSFKKKKIPNFFFRNIDKVIILNKYIFNKIEIKKKYFIPLGLNLNNQKKIFKKKKILYVGPLENRKGWDIFVGLVKKTKNDQLSFQIISYGASALDRDFINRKKNFLKKYKSKNIIFKQGKQNVVKILRSSKIFVYPLNNLNGTLMQPHTLIEAISENCTILCKKLPELTEYKKYSKNIFYFSTIKQLIKLTKQKYNISKNFNYNKNFLKHYNIYSQSKKIMSLYEDE